MAKHAHFFWLKFLQIIAKIGLAFFRIICPVFALVLIYPLVAGDIGGVLAGIALITAMLFAIRRLSNFRHETVGKSYRYEEPFTRYYKGYYLDIIVVILSAILMVFMIFTLVIVAVYELAE